jgi:hypothetical protein
VWPIVVLATFGVVVWLYVESLRIVLGSETLSCRWYGMTRWRLELDDVELIEGNAGAYGGFPALLVRSRSQQRQVGVISRMQFWPEDLAELQLQLNKRSGLARSKR